MTDIKYTVVMKKKKINGELYILVPQKLIKGTLDTTNGNYFYAEDKETFYDFSESPSPLTEGAAGAGCGAGAGCAACLSFGTALFHSFGSSSGLLAAMASW